MKNFCFTIIWAALCAWVITWILIQVDNKVGFTEMYFFPEIKTFIQNFISVKKFVFFFIFGFFLLTGINQIIGKAALWLIGVIGFVAIACLIIMIGWWFLSTLANAL